MSCYKIFPCKLVFLVGSEGILAGSVLGKDACLLHINIQNTDIDIWIKCNNKKLSEIILNECSSVYCG